jgi:hypothetical protein
MADSAAGTAPARTLPASDRSRFGVFALVWGVGGFAAMLLFAIWRLASLALASTELPWTAAHWAVFVVNLLIMGWFEGYRGFQQSYSPRLAARAHGLLHGATGRQALLAPLVCMGFLDAPRRRLIGAWALTGGIIAVVLVYRLLPQPWRGILDAGVVLGLLWGVIATLHATWRALREGPAVDAELT